MYTTSGVVYRQIIIICDYEEEHVEMNIPVGNISHPWLHFLYEFPQKTLQLASREWEKYWPGHGSPRWRSGTSTISFSVKH